MGVQEAIEKIGAPLKMKCGSGNHKAMKFYKKNGWLEGREKELYWNMVYGQLGMKAR